MWHGGPKQEGSGKFVSAQLGWDATQFAEPDLGNWPNQANLGGGDLSEKGPTLQRKPEAPRVVRKPKEPRKTRGKARKPRGKPRKARRPLRQDLLSFVKSLNPLPKAKAVAPKAQEKQHNSFQVEAQGALRNTMSTMMNVIRSGPERQAFFRKMMTPRR